MNKINKVAEIEKAKKIEDTKRRELKRIQKDKQKNNKKLENYIFKEDDKHLTSDEDGESKCTCKQCCNNYKSCISFSWLATVAFFTFIGSTIHRCIGDCCYPIKERCIDSCNKCDGELNPYKDPNYNPYDNM